MVKKIKVCHICNLGMNGKAVFVCNLLENIDFTKYDVTIVNYRSEYAEPIMNRLKELPIQIVDPEHSGIINFCFFLNKYFKEKQFDICHSHIWDLSGLFCAIAKYRGIKIRVVHSHNTSKAEGRYNWLKAFIRDKIIWNLLRFLIKNSGNRWVGCSQEACEWLFAKSIIEEKKYTIVPNGININSFRCSDRKRHNPTEILFVGRLVYQKNPLFAINVFSEYLKTDPTAHMTIIGKGKMASQVRDEIGRLGLTQNVTLISQTDHMEVYYQNADIYLLPSNYEGLAITLIEAQASGLKCLASSSISEESQCGLVKYKSLNDGTAMWGGEYIPELLNADLKINMKLLNNYDVKNTTKQIEKVYRTLV